jgi:membrane-bound lytic murein transglycosylase B
MLQAPRAMYWLAVLLGLFPLAQQAAAQAVPPPPNGVPEVAPATPAQPFDEWLQALIEEARARGFSNEIVDETLKGLEPLPRVNRARPQPGRAPSRLQPLQFFTPHRAMVNRGRDLSREHASILERVESDYDVQRRFVVAIWGMESRYGRLTGRTPVFQALATLAWEPRRADYFRGELFNALSMVASGHIEPEAMTGSWAGAMGQAQFMPSNYVKFAVDFNRDGRTDIWKSTGDALASIANYLKGFGWNDKETWGREVKVPASARDKIAESIPRRSEGCYAIRNMTTRVPLDRWRKLGVTRVDGGPLPDADVPAGLVDVGERTFLVYPNYDAILGYNCAHYYALTVALLADRLR